MIVIFFSKRGSTELRNKIQWAFLELCKIHEFKKILIQKSGFSIYACKQEQVAKEFCRKAASIERPFKNCPFSEGIRGPAPSTWFLEPTRVHKPHGILIGSVVFAQHSCSRPTDRQTHGHTDNRTSVMTISRISALRACSIHAESPSSLEVAPTTLVTF